VRDEGRGIPPDKRDLVFKRFQQVDNSDSREKGGTGLGLAIARSIVEQHGGKMWIADDVDVVSIFCFTFPLMDSVLAAVGLAVGSSLVANQLS
jgi:signal transduction histidine kinase